jgi:signal transduction histidine kinase/CheY-like chemotaxis protein
MNACLHLISSDKRRIVCQAVSQGYRATRLAFGLDLSDCPGIKLMIESKDIVTVKDALSSDLVAKVAVNQYSLRAALYTPLLVKNEPIGVMVFSYQHPHDWSADQLANARQVAAECAELLDPDQRAPMPEVTTSSIGEARLQAMLDTVPGPVAAVNQSLLTYHTNSALNSESTQSPTRWTSVSQLFNNPQRGQDLRQAVIDVCRGDLGRYEALIENANSLWRVNIGPIRINHEIEGAAVVCTDLSDILQAKAILDASRHMEALGRIASSIAHEFNNLLQIISASLELAQDAEPAEMIRHHQIIRDAVERGSKLSKQLLAYAKAHPPVVELVSLSAVVTECWPLLQNAVGKDRQLVLLMRENTTVMVDRDQLYIALLNLCINARDATTPGSEIQVQIGKVRDAGAVYGSIAVVDRGCGMSPEVLRRSIEPFFTTKPRGQGTGLGLPTARSVVEAQGGHLRIESEVGKGTTVTLLFPSSITPTTPRISSVPAKPGGSHSDLKLHKVLIVDDEDTVTAWLTAVLRREQYETHVVGSVAEAKAFLSEQLNWPDLIILDMTLRDGSGLDVYEHMLNLKRAIPIIVCSGYADSDDIRTITSAGHPLLTKPASREALVEMVKRVLPAQRGKGG